HDGVRSGIHGQSVHRSRSRAHVRRLWCQQVDRYSPTSRFAWTRMSAPDRNDETRRMMPEYRPIAAAALSTAAPSLALDEVGALVSRLYGISGSVKSLAGERDQNCCI